MFDLAINADKSVDLRIFTGLWPACSTMPVIVSPRLLLPQISVKRPVLLWIEFLWQLFQDYLPIGRRQIYDRLQLVQCLTAVRTERQQFLRHCGSTVIYRLITNQRNLIISRKRTLFARCIHFFLVLDSFYHRTFEPTCLFMDGWELLYPLPSTRHYKTLSFCWCLHSLRRAQPGEMVVSQVQEYGPVLKKGKAMVTWVGWWWSESRSVFSHARNRGPADEAMVWRSARGGLLLSRTSKVVLFCTTHSTDVCPSSFNSTYR